MLMVYLVARCWGSLLPYLAELGIAGRRQVPACARHCSISPTSSGAAAGSILTGFVLMDHMGLVAIAVTLVVAGLLCVIVLIGCARIAAPGKAARGSIGWRARRARGGCSIPRLAGRCARKPAMEGSPDAKPFVDIVENRSGIITVDADGTVFGHGMYDGQFNTDLKHDTNGIVRPYALSPVSSGAARRADDRAFVGLLGAGDRQQSRRRVADGDRDQSRLSAS